MWGEGLCVLEFAVEVVCCEVGGSYAVLWDGVRRWFCGDGCERGLSGEPTKQCIS